MDADCWFYRQNLDAAAPKQMKLSSSPKKKNSFASRPMKRLPPQEVQPPCFLLICTQAAARWHPKIPIK